jgi:hypothetical protein
MNIYIHKHTYTFISVRNKSGKIKNVLKKYYDPSESEVCIYLRQINIERNRMKIIYDKNIMSTESVIFM